MMVLLLCSMHQYPIICTHSLTQTHIHINCRTMIRYIFVALSLLGFVFFDMVYLSVIITYASQSELIQFYIMGIIDKVSTKAYSLEDAMKVLQRERERERERERL